MSVHGIPIFQKEVMGGSHNPRKIGMVVPNILGFVARGCRKWGTNFFVILAYSQNGSGQWVSPAILSCTYPTLLGSLTFHRGMGGCRLFFPSYSPPSFFVFFNKVFLFFSNFIFCPYTSILTGSYLQTPAGSIDYEIPSSKKGLSFQGK